MWAAADIGGTTTRVGLFRRADGAVPERLASWPTPDGYDDQLAALVRLLTPHRFEGLGVSIGAATTADGRVAAAPNLRDYEGQPLAADLAGRLGCPVRLAHDTVCGALAEADLGAMREVGRFAYLTLSTGTGGALHLRQGDTRVLVSIEFGHQIIDPAGAPCLCGQRGCLETITGGRQIALQHGRPVEAIDDPAFWRHFVDALATGIVNLANLTGVGSVVLGGSIALNQPRLREMLPDAVGRRRYRSGPRIVLAGLGHDAPLVGALRLLHTPPSSLLHALP